MINCLCVIQEGQVADLKRGELGTALEAYAQEFLADSVQLNWLPVPGGCGFTAGEPSTSSVVSLTATQQLTQERREQLLRELVALWTRHTGCSVDEVVAVVADPAVH